MQSYLASGFVGQTVRLALGRSMTSGRVAYIDTPSTRSPDYASLRTKHGFAPTVHSYWPGAAHPRLHLEHFPRVGPLSHTHFMLRRHQESSKSHGHLAPELTPKDVPVDTNQEVADSAHQAHHRQIEPQYVTVPRGELLPMDQYGQYHEARLKGANIVYQTPNHYATSSMKRTALEALQPIIAADADMRVVPGFMRMIAADYEAANLKPQRRVVSQRVFRSSVNMIRDTCPPVPTKTADAPFVHMNDHLERFIEAQFGYNTFSVDDIITLQRLLKQTDGDQDTLFPILTQEDINNQETLADGIREALEQRWTHFCPKPASSGGSLTVHEFRLWPAHSRDFLALLASYLQPARREDLVAFSDKLKPLLKSHRKANPNMNFKSAERSEPTDIPTSDKITEDWPLVFDTSELPTTSPLPQHLVLSGETSELDRAVIFGLALFASASVSHPIPASLSLLIINSVLQPLGYSPTPAAAQLLLTHLGLPIADPLDIPFVLHAPLEESSPSASALLNAYPWLYAKERISLQQFIDRLHDQEPLKHPLTLDSYSPRHQSLDSASPLAKTMAAQASAILQTAVAHHLQDASEDVKQHMAHLLQASKSPAFNFSKQRDAALSTSLPSIFTDSSTLLGHIDPDRETRRDMSAIPTYAIDDKSTTEVDDAFGLDIEPLRPHADWILNHLTSYLQQVRNEPEAANKDHAPQVKVSPPPGLPRTAKLFIHIADPTAAITVGDTIELGARQRVETLYLPHRKSFMLPSIMSEYYCSLQPGDHMNIGLTFEAHVNILTGALEQMDVYPSKFRGMKRFSYEAVEASLHMTHASSSDDFALKLMGKLSEARQHWRRHEGKAATMNLPKREIRLVHQPLEGAYRPTLEVYQDGCPFARSLVEEMMVTVGEISGRMANEHDLPVPYRIQPFRSHVVLHPPEIALAHPLRGREMPSTSDVKESEATRMMLVHDLQNLNVMATSQTTSIAAPHQSLGIPYYVRASSPLRRYADIVAHLQLKAWKRHGGSIDKLPYSKALVRQLAQHIDVVSKDMKYTQQASERWWKQQYVLRQAMDRTWEALVYAAPDYSLISIGLSRPNSRTVHYSFFILELELTVALAAPQPLAVGNIVQLKPIALSEINLDWQVLAPTQ